MLKKIRSLVSNSNPSFFGIYDNAISKKDCHLLIDNFESCERGRGQTIAGYNRDRKSCYELNCTFSEGNIISSIVQSALFPCISKYKKQYPGLNMVAPWRYVDYFNFQFSFFFVSFFNGVYKSIFWVVYITSQLYSFELL